MTWGTGLEYCEEDVFERIQIWTQALNVFERI